MKPSNKRRTKLNWDCVRQKQINDIKLRSVCRSSRKKCSSPLSLLCQVLYLDGVCASNMQKQGKNSKSACLFLFLLPRHRCRRLSSSSHISKECMNSSCFTPTIAPLFKSNGKKKKKIQGSVQLAGDSCSGSIVFSY